jgi:hypothetical protein
MAIQNQKTSQYPQSVKHQMKGPELPSASTNAFMHTSKTESLIQMDVNQKSTQPYPRSNSTRIQPVQSKGDPNENSARFNQQSSHSQQRQAEENLQPDNPEPNKLQKLMSQDVSQPKRREPTSRIAPKNQISGMNTT